MVTVTEERDNNELESALPASDTLPPSLAEGELRAPLFQIGENAAAQLTARDIRLVDGPDTAEGRLEVFHKQRWGSVCDDFFGEPFGGEKNHVESVACKLLSYDDGETVTGYGRPNVSLNDEPIWLDDVFCLRSVPEHRVDDPRSLFDCYHSGSGLHNCDHSEDVGLRCTGGNPPNPGPSLLQAKTDSEGRIVLVFDAALDPANLPATGAFSVTIDDEPTAVNALGTPGTGGLSAQELRLVLATSIMGGTGVHVSYTDPTGNNDANALQDADGNDASSFSQQVSDATAPALTGDPTVDGSKLVVSYDEALDGGSTPAAGAYTVNVDGAAVSSSGVSVSGTEVTLTLASAVTENQALTLSYAVPASNPVRDLAGNDATAIMNRSVSNLTIDTTTPPPGVGGGGGGGGAANRPPVIERQIEDQVLDAGETMDLDIRLNFYDRDQRALDYTVESADPSVVTVEVDRNGVIRFRGHRRGVTRVTVTAADRRQESVAQTLLVRVAGPALVPLFPRADDPMREGFLRLINHYPEDGVISITAIDDHGQTAGPVTLAIAAGAVAQFNSTDLEDGNAAKGLSGGVGAGAGDWRLVLESDLDVEVLAYIRTEDGFLTSMHDLAPVIDGEHAVATFNPGSNPDQVSHLRLVNPGSADATVTVRGVDDAGASPGTAVDFDVPGGTALTLTSSELESGTGLEGALGDGVGKWRLAVTAARPIVAMSLLSSPTGHLTNLSTVPPRNGIGAAGHTVPLFPSASDALGRQGFVRVLNRSGVAGEVTIGAYDDSDLFYDPMTLSLDAGETVHFNSDDLELGNAAKGLAGSTGAGVGDWRLHLESDLDIAVYAYIRTQGDFLTAMHDVAPSADGRHWVAIFNPGSNPNQVSRLRLVNPGETNARVSVTGADDQGATGGEVTFTVPAGASRTVTAAELESGGDGLTGRLGDGTGKWWLRVASDEPIRVMSLLRNPTGDLTNLSTAPDRAPY